MSNPEEIRKTEIEAEKLSAEVAATMLKHPKARWILQPIYRLSKWVQKQADEALKEDGWR